MLTAEQAKDFIKNELFVLVKSDENIKKLVLDLVSPEFAPKVQTEGRFEMLLKEFRSEREEQNKKWEEWNKEWKEYRQLEEKKLNKQNEKWNEQNERWNEQDKKWEENTKKFHEEIMAVSKKIDRSIGALGARWGMQSERSFRNALAGILEESFDIKVLNINEYDEKGVVFGHPDQVEIDIIVKNGLLIICELKSSMSKSEVYTFQRKVDFYEKRHGQNANRKIIISPMVKPQALDVAKKFKIEVFTDSLEVEDI